MWRVDPPARHRGFTAGRMAGSASTSGAWVLPKAISMRMDIPNMRSHRWVTPSCRRSIPKRRKAGRLSRHRLRTQCTAHRPYTGSDLKPSTGWHSEFADFNNDGLLDLYIAKGNVEKMPDFADFDPDNLLLGLHDGTFAEAGHLSGIDLDRRGRGAAIADFDLDGNLDLVVVNREAPVSVFRNRGGKTEWGTQPMGNWLQIELQQEGANRNAVGATILVKSGNETRLRKVQQVADTHPAMRVHSCRHRRCRARPDPRTVAGRRMEPPYRVFANNFVIIRRGESNAGYWYP